MEEKIILQVLAEQKEEIQNMDASSLVPRFEESLFEFDSTLAQVVIGVRRSGKSTLCHKALKTTTFHTPTPILMTIVSMGFLQKI